MTLRITNDMRDLAQAIFQGGGNWDAFHDACIEAGFEGVKEHMYRACYDSGSCTFVGACVNGNLQYLLDENAYYHENGLTARHRRVD